MTIFFADAQTRKHSLRELLLFPYTLVIADEVILDCTLGALFKLHT